MSSLVVIGLMDLEKNLFKISVYFRYFRNHLPLEKGVALHLNKLEFPSPKNALSQFWHSGSEEEDENVTFTDRQTERQAGRQTDGQTMEARRSEKLTWAFSSGELKSSMNTPVIENIDM